MMSNIDTDRFEQTIEAIFATGTPGPELDRLVTEVCQDISTQQLLFTTLRNWTPDWAPSDDANPDQIQNAWTTMWAAAAAAPAILGPALHALGRAYKDEGEYALALSPLKGAVAAYAQLDNQDGLARVSVTLSSALYSLNQYQQAEPLARQALAFFGTNSNLWLEQATCRRALAAILADTQRIDEALSEYLDARQADEQVLSVADQQEPYAKSREGLANTLIGQGSVLEEHCDDFVKAEACYQEVEEKYLADVVEWRCKFTLYLNQAILTLRLGRHAEARVNLSKAGKLVSRKDETDLIDVYLYQGYQTLLLGDYSGADMRLRQAEQLLDRLDLKHNTLGRRRQRGDLSFFLALCLSMQSCPAIDGALKELTKAENLYRSLELRQAQAMVAAERARLHYLDGRPAEARTALEEARRKLDDPQQRLSASSLRYLEVIKAEHDPDISLDELSDIAERAEAAGDLVQTLPVLIKLGVQHERSRQPQKALDAYRRAADSLVRAQGLARLSPQTTQAIEQIRKPFERIFALSASENPANAYRAAEAARTQIFLDDLVNNQLVSTEDVDDSETANLHQLRADLNRARSRTAITRPRITYGSRGHGLGEGMAIDEGLLAAQSAYDAAVQNLMARRALRRDTRPVLLEADSFEESQSLLAPGQAMLSYFAVHNVVNPRKPLEIWATLLIRQGPPLVKRILRPEDYTILKTQWAEAVKLLEESNHQQPNDRRVDEILESLGDSLLAPFVKHLRGVEHLIVVPDDRLPFVPFHALRPGGSAYLMDQCIVSYAPGATLLRMFQRRELDRNSGTGALVVGWHGDLSSRLEMVPQELVFVAGQLGTEAIHDRLRIEDIDVSLRTAHIIHLSCHGEFPNREVHPRFAHLLLGNDNLYAYDLHTRTLQAGLLTLSACNTGVAGVGLQGLFSAGLAAGASSVVASQWKVNDVATNQLMRRFYPRLLNGLGRAEALHQAQQDLRMDYQSPGLWAPFFLVGLSEALPPSS